MMARRGSLGLVGRVIVAMVVVAAGSVRPVRAEVVVLVSGRTLTVTGHRFEGDQVMLRLPSGGELVCDASVIDRIEPDDVPGFGGAEAGVVSDVRPGGPLDQLIESAARTHGVDLRLVRAVIEVESAFRPDARSPKGALGLMQLMPATAAQYAVADPFEPAANLDAGVRHLRSLLERYEVPLALAAYNAGEGAVARYGGIPPYRETIAYVRRIVGLLEQPEPRPPGGR